MLPKIQSTVDARDKKIADDLAAAEAARAAADETEAAYRARIDESRAEALKVAAGRQGGERQGDRGADARRQCREPGAKVEEAEARIRRPPQGRWPRSRRSPPKRRATWSPSSPASSVSEAEARPGGEGGDGPWLSIRRHDRAPTEAHAAASAEHHADAEPPSASTPPAWIALAMIAVFAIMIWKQVPALIGAALDKKIAGIREQLDEAAQLRAEAEALKAEYEAKAAQADAEAATMLERARAEADGIVAPGRDRRRRPGRAPHPHGRGQDRRRRARRDRRGPRQGRARRRRRRRGADPRASSTPPPTSRWSTPRSRSWASASLRSRHCERSEAIQSALDCRVAALLAMTVTLPAPACARPIRAPAPAIRREPRPAPTTVDPPRPQAPAAGLNASGSASIASSCCSGRSITAPVPFAGACRRREDLAADPEIGMAHMRLLLRAGEGEGDPPEIVGAGHADGLALPMLDFICSMLGDELRHAFAVSQAGRRHAARGN